MADLTRKTANLFDGLLIGGYFTAASFTTSGDENVFKSIKVYLSAGTYTFSWGRNVNVVRLIIDGNYSVAGGTNISLYTITSTTDGYVGISFRDTTSGTTAWDNTTPIMLNTGSTAKPYEPYGWVHSLRKMSTATEAVENPLYSDGTAITAYTLKGNTETSGTPSPSNPITISGVGNKTANLCDLSSWTNQNTDTRSYFQIVVLFMNDNTQLGKTSNIDVRTTGEKTIAINITEANCNRMQIKHNGSSRDLFIGNAYGEFYGEYTLSFNCVSNDPTTVNGIELQNIMLNTGSAALPYEPYGQYKIPISSGQTVNNYLGSIQSTRQIQKLELTGNEGWDISLGVFYLGTLTNDYLRSSGNITYISTHYQPYQQQSSAGSVPDGYFGLGNSTAVQRLYVHDSNYSTTDAFKAYLQAQYAAGTPVTIWYVLATPETGIVNEPLMKIGDYADSISNSAAIPTTDGANSITVDTTVQPSEFSATWTGWHDASVKEKSENLFDVDEIGNIYPNPETQTIRTGIVIEGLTPSSTYYFQITNPNAIDIFYARFNGNERLDTSSLNLTSSGTIEMTSTANAIRFWVSADASWSTISNIMLVEGSTTPSQYEPYWK